MSSPTMMLCLRKDRIGEGVSWKVVFLKSFFGFGGRGGVRCGEGKYGLHLLHVPGLHILAG